MVLYFIGLGLEDEKDITVKGLYAVKKSDYVFLENYTSLLQVPVEKLEEFYGKKIIGADRNLVENNADEILDKAKDKNVSFLVVGDIFGATTHTDLWLRAKEKNIECRFIHNASVINVAGSVGLELYKFGKTTSIVFPEKNYNPKTAYDVIKMNKKNGLHTLCLLDIKSKDNKFMSVKEGLNLLLEKENELGKKLINGDTKVIGCARLGCKDKKIKYSVVKDLLKEDFGKPPHCIIVPGELHFIEEEALKNWV
ncbi:diphthine synthase [Candidatus Woesearchaeota archaeon]|nr:diphthine synthase [Candidatus Woesearchaeota archaeon]